MKTISSERPPRAVHVGSGKGEGELVDRDFHQNTSPGLIRFDCASIRFSFPTGLVFEVQLSGEDFASLHVCWRNGLPCEVDAFGFAEPGVWVQHDWDLVVEHPFEVDEIECHAGA